MKHTIKITLLLIALFIIAQVIGLATITKYIKPITTITATGDQIITIEHADTVVGPQPVYEQKSYSFIPIVISVLIGTAILLVLIRFRLNRVWKFWFFIAIFITLAVSFGVYSKPLIAFSLAFILAGWRIFKPNPFVHNFTEVFIYTGIAIVILPFLNVISALILLIIISIYDIYAVWKSKHMVKMAKFQTENMAFAGLFVQYGKKSDKDIHKVLDTPAITKTEVHSRNAILGGGDIAFPLFFSSAVLESLIVDYGLNKLTAFFYTLIIPFFVTIALAILLSKGEKDKFYPAMPFLTIGCLIGYSVILLL